MTTTSEFTMRRPDDFHVHLREEAMLEAVLPHTSKRFGRALVMPNLEKGLTEAEEVWKYKDAILWLSEGTGFVPLMTIKLTDRTTPAEIERTIRMTSPPLIRAAKLYPAGATTNSEGGVTDLAKLEDVFRTMADHGVVLSVHAEEPSAFCLDRESIYLSRIGDLAGRIPHLKIVVEHITTAQAFGLVHAHDNMAATITVHHLFLTLDDVVGGAIRPHHFCKPIAKRPEDQMVLRMAALSGDRKFFLGTDSAPHARSKKEAAAGCAGCFTSPVAIELLAELFAEQGKLAELESFASRNGAAFYGLPPNGDTITLVREPWTVPAEYSRWGSSTSDAPPVVPFKAGETLEWRIKP